MINRLVMGTFTWTAARIINMAELGPRILQAISVSQYGANFSRYLSTFSNRGVLHSRNLACISVSVNQPHLSVGKSNYTTCALPTLLKFTPGPLHDIKTNFRQNTCQSSFLICTRCVQDDSTRTPLRRLKTIDKDNKQDTGVPDDVAKQYVSSEESSDPSKNLTIVQRFKKTYKEHGKVLVGVHLVTSAVWYGGFYGAATWGVDIVPFLESWNFGESYIKPFRAGGAGNFALAYLFYKLATPARYTVTIVGTNLTIKFLKRGGQIKQVPSEDTLTELYKESKTRIKRRSSLEMRKGVKNMRKGVKNMKSNIKSVRSKVSNKRTKPKDKDQ